MDVTGSLSGYLGAVYLYLLRNGVDCAARAGYFPNFDAPHLSLLVITLAMPLNRTSAVALTLPSDHVIDAPGRAEKADAVFSAGLQADF